MWVGTLRTTNNSANTSITSSAFLSRPTSNAKECRVYASTGVSHFSGRPSRVRVVDEIPRRYVVFVLRATPAKAVGAVAHLPPFLLLFWHLQSHPSPEPTDTFTTDSPTLPS